jgi:hypothetical protein
VKRKKKDNIEISYILTVIVTLYEGIDNKISSSMKRGIFTASARGCSVSDEGLAV